MSKKEKRRRAQTKTRDVFEEYADQDLKEDLEAYKKAQQIDRRLLRKIKAFGLDRIFGSLT